MINVLRAIGETGDVVGMWKVARQPSRSITIEVSSRREYASEQAANEVAASLARRLLPTQYGACEGPEIRVVLEGPRAPGRWRARVRLEVTPPLGADRGPRRPGRPRAVSRPRG